jgi:hypothetical protein
MSKLKTGLSLTRILFFLAMILVVAVFYAIGRVPQSQAIEQPKCGASAYLCDLGTSLDHRWDSAKRLFFWNCFIDPNTLACQSAYGCGNNKADPGEDCDGSDLNGQSCKTLGYDSGTLKCNASCFFDESGCTYNAKCGNHQLDPGEQCDGSILNNMQFDTNHDGIVDCKDFGYTGGTLSCGSDCNFNTSGCTKSLGICGDGKIEAGEQCDGLDLGGATCSSLGCGTGTLKCNLDCTFNKSSCSDPTCTTSGCQNKTASDWTGLQSFTKPCCGSADGQFFDSAPTTQLCAGGGTPTPVKEVDDSSGNVSKWTWSCGQTSCAAYAQAHCAGAVSQETSECTTGVTFKSEDDFNAAVTANGGKVCTVGTETADSICSDRGWNPTFNKEWLCVGAAPAGKQNQAHCIVGWAPASQCGTEDGTTYTVKASDDCSQSPFWQVENKPETPDLCAKGNVLVAGSKEYVPPEWPFDNNQANRQFTWQCKSTFGPRFGSPVDCAVNLSGSCSSKEGKCGNDVNGHYAVPGNNAPGRSLCLLGQSSNLSFDAATWTWHWVCSAGGNDKSCLVTAEAVCGPADKGDYATEAEVRAAGPCSKGNLTAGKIYDRGAQWEWSCESSADPKVYVVCHASTTKCGHAGDRTYLTNTFDANKGNDGFLCSAGTAAKNLSGPTYNDNFKRSDWTWQCGSLQCRATKLECGFGDNNAYHFINDFNAGRNAWSSYLCSGGVVASFQETASGWSWGCWNGDTKYSDTIASCAANKYRCGDLNKKTISWSAFYSLFGVTSQQDCTGKAITSDLLCPGGVAICLNDVDGKTPSWYCQTPASDGGKYIDSCSANILSCGQANGGWYVFANLQNHYGKDDGFLCAKTSTSDGLHQGYQNGVPTANWTCQGEAKSSIGCSSSLVDCGYGGASQYSSDQDFKDRCSGANSSTCLCTNNNQNSVPRYPGFNSQVNGWIWQCRDQSGYTKTEGCVAEKQ